MYGSWEDDLENTRFLAIWEKFPLNFKYLASARELDGKIALVLVLKDGYNEESLKKTDIPSLIAPYTKVFTAGIWVHI